MLEEASAEAQLNDLAENFIKFEEEKLIKLTKNDSKSIEREAKMKCKILKTSSDCSMDEIFATFSSVDPVEYPNLFIFIIESQSSNFLVDKRSPQDSFVQFGKGRPLIIQLTCSTENVTKFYYKAENSTKVFDIDQKFPENHELFEQCQNKLRSLVNGELGTTESEMLKKLSFIRDSPQILRFLRTLNLQEAFFGTLVLEIAKGGSKKDLLAVLDTPFEGDGRILNSRAQDYIRYPFDGDESEKKASVKSNTDEVEGSDAKNPSDEQNKNDKKDVASVEDSDSSVLLTAIKHSNKEVIDYLITYWSHLIQQLPFKHLVRISTAAFETNQLDVLCDLLEIADFPFPSNYGTRESQVTHNNLLKITAERTNLKVDIEEESLIKIDEFIDNHSSLKIVYDSKNQSLMKRTVDLKKYSIYFHLKSHGFHATEFNCLEAILDEKEFKEANKQAAKQRIKNTKEALCDTYNSIYWLCTKSRIHNRKITKEEEAECRKKIKNWYEDIYKVAPELLDVAASCENLKIIFDFESMMVDRVAFKDNSLGVAFSTKSSNVFVGAKLGDKKREQEIKGVLVHEMCHYVMCLVFENHFLPYYQHAPEFRDVFTEIVIETDKWSSKDSQHPDDECYGIISTVFKCYESKDFHSELIVRAVHILTQFDDNPEKSRQLQDKYRILFNFWNQHVLPELQNFNIKRRNAIRNLNKSIGFLSRISNQELELLIQTNVKELTENKITIISTNVPTLLFIHIHKQIEEKYGNLFDAKFIFADPEKLCIEHIWEDFNQACEVNPNTNVIVDCTKEVSDYLGNIFINKQLQFIFVVSNAEQDEKLAKICEDEKVEVSIKQEMHYSWKDLAVESQKLLLETKITFQKNSEFKLLDLIEDKKEESAAEPKEENFGNLNEIIDDELLNLLVDEQEIKINQMLEKDQSENYFEFLFRPRSYVRKKEGIRISQERLFSDIQGKQYVLLSDIAGTGKSWAMKNFSSLFREKNPTRWVTYVNLKQFIEEFKELKEKPEFSKFMVEKVLKHKSKFEGEIFKKLYKNGKACIIFDGFDEIAPNCAEFVATLAKSFEFNGGNQLWIATRDYFEVDLKQRLHTDQVYGLDEFSEEEGIDFIVSSWVLVDLKKNNENISRNDFENFPKSSPNLENYHHKAHEIVQKVATSQNRSVGSPQLFKMIAESFKDNEDIAIDLTGTKIYGNFVQNHYKKWSDEKGQLRKEASIKSQENEFNFWKFHQFCAIKSLFPELADLLFPDYDDSEWTEEEIIACGLMSKKGGKFYFLHETFREFFTADFIAKTLKRQKINEIIFELFITILTMKKYKVIRMFLNDVIDESMVEKIGLKMTNLITKFHEKETFSEFFTENLENLVNLFIKLFKSANYEGKRNILFISAGDVLAHTKEQKMFLKFQEFMFEALNGNDVRYIVHKHRIFHKIVEARFEIEVFEDVVMKTLNRTDCEFVRQELKVMDENILHDLFKSQNFCPQKVQKSFEIIQEFLTKTEIFELIESCDSKGRNILQMCLMEKEKRKLEILWMQIQNFYSSQQLSDKFKELVKQKDSDDYNLLHVAAKYDNSDHFKTLWKLLLEIFENQEELNDLILQKNKFGNNFIHLLVVNNEPEIIEFTFKSLKENLNESQYKEILRTRGQYKRNLLQLAACNVKQAETFQIVWKNVKTLCKSNKEFLEMLEEVDGNGSNVLNIAACFTTGEVFEFMESELVKIASLDEIRKLIKNLNKWKRNLLQQAAYQNKSLELHEVLWKIIKKYFDSSEILEFIKHLDVYGDNFLINASENNTREIKELTWKEVKKVLNSNNCGDEELSKNIERCEKIIKNILQSAKLKDDEKELLKLKWVENENSNSSKLFDNSAQLVLLENLIVKTVENLKFFMADESLENHEILWNHLLKIYTSREELKKLLTEKDKDGNNFIHLLVTYNKTDVIEFTFGKLKKNLSESQFQEILRSKGFNGRNLLQKAAISSKEVKKHQILWKVFQDSCKSNEEFLEILNEVDDDGDNVFNLAASYTRGEIFELLEAELAKIASQDEIRKLLKNLNKWRLNLLQQAANLNESLQLHETLWKVIKKYFNSFEVLEFIKHLNKLGNNLLIYVSENMEEIKELTLKEVKKVLNNTNCEDEEFNKNIEQCEKIIKNAIKSVGPKDDEKEFLKLKWMKNENSDSSKLFGDSTQLVLLENLIVKTVENLKFFMTGENVENHQILWTHLLKTFKSRGGLKNLLAEKDEDGNNFIHNLVMYNKADVIEFTFEKLKENLSEQQYQEILRSKGQYGRNLLQIAARNSKEVKAHKILWKTFQDSCKSKEEFLEILKEVDENKRNVFYLATCFSAEEIFEFMFAELEKFASTKETKKILSSLGLADDNFLQSLVAKHKRLETHKIVWKIICKYFDASEILEFINHSEKFGGSLLSKAVYHNTKEIVEFIWNQIKIFITSKDDQVEYLKQKGHKGKNLHQLALENKSSDHEVALWVQNVMQEFEIPFSD